MKSDFEAMFDSLSNQFKGTQKRIDIQSSLSVYYGISQDGCFRLAFLSKYKPPKMESTKLIRVAQGEESKDVCWSCFDLLNPEAKLAFFAFCQNMVEAVENESDEMKALSTLKKRFVSWKALFKKGQLQQLSKEVLQGLYGELYFLNQYMIPTFGANESVAAWGGPESTSKDFAVETKWFEVKTIGSSSPCVKISSLAQLSSDIPGNLAVIRVEQMPATFSNGLSSIADLVSAVLSKLRDEMAEDLFVSKLSSFGVDFSDLSFQTKYDVKSLHLYTVSQGFPRITFDEVPYSEINNVTYEISVAAISRFMEE